MNPLFKISFIRYFFLILITLSCTNLGKKNSQNQNDSNSTILNNSNNQSNQYFIDSVVIHETLGGWLKENIAQKIVIDSIGLPDNKTDEELWDALGLYVQTWEYKRLGLFLELKSEKKGGTKSVLSITAIAPCVLKTSKGIGIGTSKNLVIEKYSNDIDQEETNDSLIIVGSIYGGTAFTLKEEIVNQIYIGAIAE